MVKGASKFPALLDMNPPVLIDHIYNTLCPCKGDSSDSMSQTPFIFILSTGHSRITNWIYTVFIRNHFYRQQQQQHH